MGGMAAALCSLLVLLLPAVGQCEDTGAGSDSPTSDWEFASSIYLWVSAVDGETQADGVEADVDLSFGDIIDQTDFAFMGTIQANYQRRWFYFFDLVFADISDDEKFATPMGTAFLDVDSRQIRADLAVGRRILSRPLSELLGSPPRSADQRVFHLDLFGGLRYWYLKDEIELSIPPQFVSTSNSDWWIDPLVGARARLDVSERLWVDLSGSVGGFGIGEASDFTWQLWAVASYRFAERWAVAGGYRVTVVDRDQGSNEQDLLWHGPMLGMTYWF